MHTLEEIIKKKKEKRKGKGKEGGKRNNRYN